MPGQVSDSYDPEWGTGANADEIRTAIASVYASVSEILGQQKPMYILDLVEADLPRPLTAQLTEWQWRIIRFALERAEQSI